MLSIAPINIYVKNENILIIILDKEYVSYYYTMEFRTIRNQNSET